MKKLLILLLLLCFLTAAAACATKDPISTPSEDSSSDFEESFEESYYDYSIPEESSIPASSQSRAPSSSSPSSVAVSSAQTIAEITTQYLNPVLSAKDKTDSTKAFDKTYKLEIKRGSVMLYNETATLASSAAAALYDQNCITKDALGGALGSSNEQKYFNGTMHWIKSSNNPGDIPEFPGMFEGISFFRLGDAQIVENADSAISANGTTTVFNLKTELAPAVAGQLLPPGEHGFTIQSVKTATINVVANNGYLVSQYISISFITDDNDEGSIIQYIEVNNIGTTREIEPPDWVLMALE